MFNGAAILLIGGVILIASLVQGVTGFGFSLVALPLLGIFLPLRLVVPMLVLYSLLLNLAILFSLRREVKISQLKQIGLLALAGVISTPFGAYLLQGIDEHVLKVLLGIIITVTAALNLRGYTVKIKQGKLSSFPIGIVSGLLHGSVSLGGPPVALFFSNQGVSKTQFRGNLTVYFLILNLITIPTYLVGGLINQEVLTVALYVLPGLILGTWAGIALSGKINEGLFRKLTLVLIVVMGLVAVISGMQTGGWL